LLSFSLKKISLHSKIHDSTTNNNFSIQQCYLFISLKLNKEKN
jgi:hypothetical protein